MPRLIGLIILACLATCAAATTPPNIVLVMSDDQGWGQTGYNHHPLLKTPNLDRMAAAGLRFNRFYAGASNCSPTRATVLTGRTNDRCGVRSHGYPMRRQEKTLAQALKAAGYVTGHFGKWHLNGLRGPGAPILASDPLNPGIFGFDTWISVTNFFDLHPLMSRNGHFEPFSGDSSEIVVAEALRFIRKHHSERFLAVIWFGTPHSPFMAFDDDMAAFAGLPDSERRQLGELVAMDRAVGTLRAGLRELGVAENTIVWFNSDNGGLPLWGPKTVGGLRGFKGQVYEGGIRVPGIVEWPGRIKPGRVTDFPAVTMDIFPTIGEIVGLGPTSYIQPLDGISLVPLFEGKEGPRPEPIPFRRMEGGAIIDNAWKLLSPDLESGKFELYDLSTDPSETTDLFAARPDEAARMMKLWEAFDRSLRASVAGEDYPEGKVLPDPEDRKNGTYWWELADYQPYLRSWLKRPEYERYLKKYLEK